MTIFRGAVPGRARADSRVGVAALLMTVPAPMVLPSAAGAEVASIKVNRPFIASYEVVLASFGAQQFSLSANAALANPANACTGPVAPMQGQDSREERAFPLERIQPPGLCPTDSARSRSRERRLGS